MKLGSPMDYHGSRAYAPDPPSTTSGSRVRRYGGRLAAWVKQMFETVLRPDARQAAETIWLMDDKGKHFSLLGLNRTDRKRRRAATAPCPFPEAEVRARRLIRSRSDSE